MKVGTICKLKVDCLGNKAGTLGVVFYDYVDGFQAIFENGNLDGFSTKSKLRGFGVPGIGEVIEADHFLEEVGYEESLAGYHFFNVRKVTDDYREGLFDIAWSEGWKLKAGYAEILSKHKFGIEKLADYLNQNYTADGKKKDEQEAKAKT